MWLSKWCNRCLSIWADKWWKCYLYCLSKGFGWGSEINLENIFYKLFEEQFGLGYPKERREIEQKNKQILDEVKKVTTKDMLTIIKEINEAFLKDTLSHETFTNYLLENSKDEDINNYIKLIL